MATIRSLQDQAYEAGGKNALTLFRLHGKKPCAEIYLGYAKAFAEAYGAIVGPSVAAEALYRLADAQVDRVNLETDEAGIRKAIIDAAARAARA